MESGLALETRKTFESELVLLRRIQTGKHRVLAIIMEDGGRTLSRRLPTPRRRLTRPTASVHRELTPLQPAETLAVVISHRNNCHFANTTGVPQLRHQICRPLRERLSSQNI
jgi:hypothetical protein